MKNKKLYQRALISALKYDFVDNIGDLKMLANAIYLALEWGRKVK